ncbi:MAG: YncE family protein [Dehalococcoidales bacterium]|nr:YncE family protein [Dehalococcoidales bacterium]
MAVDSLGQVIVAATAGGRYATVKYGQSDGAPGELPLPPTTEAAVAPRSPGGRGVEAGDADAVDQLATAGTDTPEHLGEWRTASAMIAVGKGPSGLAVNPGVGHVYVANWSDGTVSVIDTSTDTVIETVAVGMNPRAVALNPLTKRVYVANYGSGNVSVIQE